LGSGLLLGAVTIVFGGRLLVRIDPLPQAGTVDAIYVLGGSRIERWLQAVDIYEQVGARRILLTRTGGDAGEQLLIARGIDVPNDAEWARSVMIKDFGIPPDVIEVLDDYVDNTAHEADVVVDRANTEGWRELIVITTMPATRRTSFAFRRVLNPSVNVTVRDTRFDGYEPTWWWRSRDSIRQTYVELPKLIVYWLGLGA
jgi:uncharacterized SAM-binding protein YcdF (DUF218 family)